LNKKSYLKDCYQINKIKICSRCKIELPISKFSKGTDKDNLQYWCKNCINQLNQKNYQLKYPDRFKKKQLKQKLLNKGLKICSICQIEKSINEFYKDKRHEQNALVARCKNCRKNYVKKHTKERIFWQCLPQSIYNKLIHSAKKRNIRFNISKQNFINWYNSQDKVCYYCNRTLEEIKQDIKEKERNKNRLTIERKDNNKGYVLDNLVLACYRCNAIKSNYYTEEEMLKIGKLLYNIKGLKNE